MDLYHNPANLFVAGFLGSPSMNFIEVTVDGVSEQGATVSGASIASTTLARHAGTFTEGQTATLGIRPQDLRPISGASGLLNGKVVVTERLGKRNRGGCEARCRRRDCGGAARGRDHASR